MTKSERDHLLQRCREALGPGYKASPDHAREMYNLGCLFARQGYKECQAVGLDADAEYSATVDRAEALEKSLAGKGPDA